MNVKRRNFLKGSSALVAGAAALAALPALIKIAAPQYFTYPTLYGDGLHDDTGALQAIYNGHKVIDARSGQVLQATNKTPVVINGGIYKISDTIHIRHEDAPVHITQAIINAAAPMDVMLNFHRGSGYNSVTSCCINTANYVDGAWQFPAGINPFKVPVRFES